MIVTQTKKQIQSQSSFSKDPGGPKNKEQNFYAHFHNIDMCEMGYSRKNPNRGL